MGIKIIKKAQPKPPKRKAGARAGLTRDKIRADAIILWRDKRAEDFSVLALANAMGVAPVSIRSMFKGGTGEILDEIARSLLDEIAPPYGPQLDAKTYLKEIFVAVLVTFPKSPSIGRQALLRLANRSLLSPRFAERVCASLLSLAPKSDPALGLNLVINRLSGLALIETGRWANAAPGTVEKEIKKVVSDLPESEFPTLHKAVSALAKDFEKRSKKNYVDQLATAAAEEIVAELKSASG